MDEETRLVPRRDSMTAAPNEVAVVPAPATLDELTTKVVAALDVVTALIPDLRKPHPSTAKRVRGARTVSREAVTSIVAMVESSPMLQRLVSFDPNHAREVLESIDGFRIVAERVAMLLAQVKYTNEERWAEVVGKAMTAYQTAATLARDPSDAELAAHVATIRRHLGRRNAATGKKRGKREAPPESG